MTRGTVGGEQATNTRVKVQFRLLPAGQRETRRDSGDFYVATVSGHVISSGYIARRCAVDRVR